jgi:hypothetical protein
MQNGYVVNSVVRVFDRRSENGYAKAKNPRADPLEKLYLATNPRALSPGFNASIDGSLFDGNA